MKTPLIYEQRLWERSGHWEKFREHMFLIPEPDRTYSIKPMNCPGHMILFASTLRSYRELPLRYAEAAPLHRNELAGHPPRPDARPPRHPGRCTHLLHPRADRGRDLRLCRLRDVPLRALRPGSTLRALDPSGEQARHRRGVGLHRRRPSGRTGAARDRVRSERGRRRVLRAEDRPPHDRFAWDAHGRWARSSSIASSPSASSVAM